MITKSMSRKTPSFSQLAEYMDSEKSDGCYDIHHNCFVTGQDNIARVFYENSQHLSARKNANYLYHEIISITLEEGVDRDLAKQCLRELTEEYIQSRCPNNMVFGCLHEDHEEHLHYHLMISANELGEKVRFRMTKKQFDTMKRDLESHALENYPQLKQRKIVTAERGDKIISNKASKQKQRTGKLERQEAVRATIAEAMNFARNLEDFKTYLEVKRYRFYTRGKHYGVEVTHDTGKIAKYRFATIGAHEDFESYLATLEQLKEAEPSPEGPQEEGFERNASSGGAGETSTPDEQEKQAEDAGPKEKDHGEEEPLQEEPPKSEFVRDVENIYAKKREKQARKKSRKLERKPRRR